MPNLSGIFTVTVNKEANDEKASDSAKHEEGCADRGSLTAQRSHSAPHASASQERGWHFIKCDHVHGHTGSAFALTARCHLFS